MPSPEAIAGYPIGSRFSDHQTVLRVFDAVCAASDRARLEPYGRTPKGRPLLLALVSSPENLARAGEIGARLAALRDPRGRDPNPSVGDLPVVVWLSFSVHGNEPSGTEAAMKLLYHLAASEDPRVEALLERVLVVIDPCLNPDGRDRYVHGFRARMGAEPDPDPQAVEHREPWPGGRTNDRLFDLNRDWAFLTQEETRARLRAMKKLPPQVHVDLHEMNYESSYFFFPSARPRNAHIPDATLDLGAAFGRANAAAFDLRGWAYYTGENYDLLFPGYGDSWPTLNGAIGMTYEQAGHGAAGLAIRREDGTVLTLGDRVERHLTSALATVETAAERRHELLEHFAQFFEDAVYEGARGRLRQVALLPCSDPGRLDDLVEILALQGIAVYRLQAAVETSARALFGSAPDLLLMPEGTCVVPMDQPAGRLARSLLEPHAATEENAFYDISAWCLPLAYGMEALALESPVELDGEPLGPPGTRSGEVAGGAGRVGYLVAWDSSAAPRVAARLLAKGHRVQALLRRTRIEGRVFGPGTLFVPALSNGDVGASVRSAAAATGANAFAIDTGLAEEGPDLGSDSLLDLRPPRVALAVGAGTAPSSVGSHRFVLERGLGLSVTRLELASLGEVDLGRYDVLVLPDGAGVAPRVADLKDPLNGFVTRGGTLIACSASARALCESKIARARAEKPAERPGESEGDGEGWMRHDRERRRREANLPGTFFQVKLDPDHPLSFGVGPRVAALLTGRTVLQAAAPGDRVGVFSKSPLLSGYAEAATIDGIANRDWLVVERKGRGHVVLFSSDPTFRGFLRGLRGILANAVFFLHRG